MVPTICMKKLIGMQRLILCETISKTPPAKESSTNELGSELLRAYSFVNDDHFRAQWLLHHCCQQRISLLQLFERCLFLAGCTGLFRMER